jgi:long-subunit acyl-CoA synthetase (AMP-forming)
MHDA